MNSPTLFDHSGRKINLDALQSERGRPQLASVRTVWQPFVAPGLTPQRLAVILQEAVQGNHQFALTLADEMEERDTHYSSVLRTRKLAVSAIEPTVEAVDESAEEEEIAQFLRDLLAEPEAGDLVSDMMDAVGKGFSVIEILWACHANKWVPTRYEWRDPRFFRFDRTTMSTPRLLGPEDPSFGTPLEPFKWIVHYPKLKTGIPIRGGLARLVAASYVCKSFTLKDWLAFAEVFGMPIRVGKFGPKATEEDIGILVSAVANLGTDAAAVIPDTMKIEFEESVNAAGGGVLFQALAKYLDEGVSKAVLGQTSSADSGASGLGGGQRAKLHGDVKTDIRDDDANKCARTLCRDWVRPIVDLNFGRRERYPRVRIALKEPDDLVSLSQALPPFLDRGLKIPAATIYAKFGFDPPEGDEDVLVPLAKPGGPPSAPPETNRAQNDQDEIDRLRAQALGDWEPQLADVIAPIRQALDQATSPEDFERRLTALRGQLNTSKFQAALALAMFQSRVAGEAGEHD